MPALVLVDARLPIETPLAGAAPCLVAASELPAAGRPYAAERYAVCSTLARVPRNAPKHRLLVYSAERGLGRWFASVVEAPAGELRAASHHNGIVFDSVDAVAGFLLGGGALPAACDPAALAYAVLDAAPGTAWARAEAALRNAGPHWLRFCAPRTTRLLGSAAHRIADRIFHDPEALAANYVPGTMHALFALVGLAVNQRARCDESPQRAVPRQPVVFALEMARGAGATTALAAMALRGMGPRVAAFYFFAEADIADNGARAAKALHAQLDATYPDVALPRGGGAFFTRLCEALGAVSGTVSAHVIVIDGLAFCPPWLLSHLLFEPWPPCLCVLMPWHKGLARYERYPTHHVRIKRLPYALSEPEFRAVLRARLCDANDATLDAAVAMCRGQLTPGGVLAVPGVLVKPDPPRKFTVGRATIFVGGAHEREDRVVLCVTSAREAAALGPGLVLVEHTPGWRELILGPQTPQAAIDAFCLAQAGGAPTLEDG